MASYRLEVIFWGVRDMKKINYVPVLRPRIIIECAGVDVKSEVMENAKKFSNFEEPHIVVDLVTRPFNTFLSHFTVSSFRIPTNLMNSRRTQRPLIQSVIQRIMITE